MNSADLCVCVCALASVDCEMRWVVLLLLSLCYRFVGLVMGVFCQPFIFDMDRMWILWYFRYKHKLLFIVCTHKTTYYGTTNIKNVIHNVDDETKKKKTKNFELRTVLNCLNRLSVTLSPFLSSVVWCRAHSTHTHTINQKLERLSLTCTFSLSLSFLCVSCLTH